MDVGDLEAIKKGENAVDVLCRRFQSLVVGNYHCASLDSECLSQTQQVSRKAKSACMIGTIYSKEPCPKEGIMYVVNDEPTIDKKAVVCMGAYHSR